MNHFPGSIDIPISSFSHVRKDQALGVITAILSQAPTRQTQFFDKKKRGRFELEEVYELEMRIQNEINLSLCSSFYFPYLLIIFYDSAVFFLI